MKAKILASIFVLGPCGAAHAGQYANKIAKCLVDNVSAEESRVPAQWVFAGWQPIPPSGA
jgi:hypothetical protein